MSLSPDIKYLRVRHTGKTEGSLHLSDLDTEENKNESYKIPVYVPENGSVDLPLNDQVLLSFSQGSIRGHIDEGRIDGHVVSDDGSAEVWVSPDGDDQNPGTRNAPFESIQYAIDTLVESVGHFESKTIKLKFGTYEENVHIYTKRLSLISTGQGSTANPRIVPKDDSKPVLSIDNWTSESYEEFWADGGVDYSITNDVLEYTGAQLTERELAYPLDSFGDGRLGIRIENVEIYRNSAGAPCVTLLGGPEPGEINLNMLGEVLFLRSSIWASGTADTAVYTKNFGLTSFVGVDLFFEKRIILDNSGGLTFQKEGVGFPNGRIVSDIIARYGVDDVAIEGESPMTRTFDFVDSHFWDGNFTIQGNARIFEEDSTTSLKLLGNVTLNHSTSSGSFKMDTVKCSDLTIRGTCDIGVDRLMVTSLTKEGTATGDLLVGTLNSTGDVTISASGTVIRGGTIEGNLTVAGGVDIDLTGVHVMGNVTIDQGAGVVTWKGGSFYGTLTDDDNKLGAATAGDYLNVG